MDPLSLGIDLGTTSIKVLVVDPIHGHVKQEASQETQAAISLEDASKSEQSVVAIFRALDCIMEKFNPEDLKRITSIGVSGQMHGVVLWSQNAWIWADASLCINGEKVSNLVTWQDSRCSTGFLSSLPSPDSHLKAHTGFGVPTLFWFQQNDPEVLQGYSYAGTIQDFLVVALTNNRGSPLMSPQNAASWGYYNTTQMSWNVDILEQAAFPTRLLPEVKNGLAGDLHSEWKGISAGCKVGIALGDLQASVYSILGNTGDNEAVVNISTSAQVALQMPDGFEPSDSGDKPRGVEFFPYFDGKYLAVAAALTGGHALATFVNALSEWLQEFGFTVPKSEVWSTFLCAGLKQKSTSLTISPVLFGERTDPDMRGIMRNMSTSNLSLGDLSRAFCRGMIANLEQMMSREFLLQQGISKINGSGSALARNKILEEEIRSIYHGISLELCGGGDSAVGAALFVAEKVGYV